MSVLTKEKQKNEVEQEEIAMEFNPEELEAVKEEQEQQKEQPFIKKKRNKKVSMPSSMVVAFPYSLCLNLQ